MWINRIRIIDSQMRRLTDVKAVFQSELNFKTWKPEDIRRDKIENKIIFIIIIMDYQYLLLMK